MKPVTVNVLCLKRSDCNASELWKHNFCATSSMVQMSFNVYPKLCLDSIQ